MLGKFIDWTYLKYKNINLRDENDILTVQNKQFLMENKALYIQASNVQRRNTRLENDLRLIEISRDQHRNNLAKLTEQMKKAGMQL